MDVRRAAGWDDYRLDHHFPSYKPGQRRRHVSIALLNIGHLTADGRDGRASFRYRMPALPSSTPFIAFHHLDDTFVASFSTSTRALFQGERSSFRFIRTATTSKSALAPSLQHAQRQPAYGPRQSSPTGYPVLAAEGGDDGKFRDQRRLRWQSLGRFMPCQGRRTGCPPTFQP